MVRPTVAPRSQDGVVPSSTADLLRRVDAALELPLLGNRPAWRDSGACVGIDAELFFPERGAPVGPAKRVCRACAVRRDCLEHALAHGEKFGIWGGLSERERRRIRSRRRLAASIGPDR